MTEAEAIAYVTLHAGTASFPCVEASDVTKIVQDNMRASVWTAATAYRIGDRVQPATPNGHFYECIVPGESDSVEPDWSTKMNSQYREFASDLVWQECAIDVDGNLYNLRNAIHTIWTLKAAMASSQFDISIDSQKWNRSQVYEHCLKMAEKYLPFD